MNIVPLKSHRQGGKEKLGLRELGGKAIIGAERDSKK